MSEPSNLFQFSQGSLVLDRYPEPEVNLRAWNAADAYLLDWVGERRSVGAGPCCVVNDSFGALALGLVRAGETEVVSWSDSWLAHQGARANALGNGIDPERVEWLASTEPPRNRGSQTRFGLVVIRVPKSLGRLRDQLEQLAPMIGPDTLVVAGGMTKQIHTSTIGCFENVLGPTTTSLARRKARLITPEPVSAPPPVPDRELRRFRTDDGLEIFTDPGLFSSARVDPATALLLDALRSPGTSVPRAGDGVVDLGCGTGVVGLTLLARDPTLNLVFTDESYLAVATSERSLVHNMETGTIDSSSGPHRFLVDDCGASIADGSVDVVCINPPFHDATAQTEAIAGRMFANAARMLRASGTVVVVGNRHLHYHARLRSWFNAPTVLASDRRFVVLSAQPKQGTAGG